MRRSGRKGNYLGADDYTGVTQYFSSLKKDFWGAYAVRPLLRNLQEIASPLDDPQPVPAYRGPDYEYFNPCDAEVAPQFVGVTNIPTNPNNAGFQALDLNPAIPNMSVGCTLIVH